MYLLLGAFIIIEENCRIEAQVYHSDSCFHLSFFVLFAENSGKRWDEGILN
jgi:hypothetical protein